MTLELGNNLLANLEILRNSEYINSLAKDNMIDLNIRSYRRYIIDYMCLFFIAESLFKEVKKENKVDEIAFVYDYDKGRFGFNLSYKSVDLGDVQSINFKGFKDGALKFIQCEPLKRIVFNNPFGVEESIINNELRIVLNQALSFVNSNKKCYGDSLDLYERKIYSNAIPLFVIKKLSEDAFQNVEYISIQMTSEKNKVYNKVLKNYIVFKDKLVLENDLFNGLSVNNKKSLRI